MHKTGINLFAPETSRNLNSYRFNILFDSFVWVSMSEVEEGGRVIVLKTFISRYSLG